ncbi:OmpA family protein [Dinghuibacter silviterrae]|uniref:OOP family OmpA-OmpF porin n=1 Tax=Dinghuibacter silviterrae TaxID=1539049 RepID=A0A4R8DU56_9BACT|nr:OmpA family protein [Dinghuibacter silviterrae]TDX01884.1 OOP family OmpA-OmpF porin [Dinghuibacter silviterrae]
MKTHGYCKLTVALTVMPALFVALALRGQPLLAQDTTTHFVKPLTGASGFRTWSIGLTGGALAPVAGIGGTNDYTQWMATLGYGAYIKYQVTHGLGFQLDYLGGTLQGNNSKVQSDGTYRVGPYSSFKTDLHWTGTLSAVYSFTNINWLWRRNILIPYVSLGAGMAGYAPTMTASSGETVAYKPGSEIHEFVVPVGAGCKFNVAPGINIDLGYKMYFLDADNLDGTERIPGHKDRFSYGYAGLEFALGPRSKPQLAADNPVYDLHRQMRQENEELRSRLMDETQAALDANKAKLAQVTALQEQIDKMKSDADGDGVSDYFDKCPNTPPGVKVDGSGCPLDTTPRVQTFQITEEDRRIVREAIQNLEFDFAKASIRPTSYPSLDRVAEILVNKHFSLKLAGHTDNVGSPSRNMRLSKDRAESVKAYLVSRGANPSRIEATGYGQTQPIASNRTADGRQKNRRVEFTLY